MTSCPMDGSVRTIAARDETGVWWRCPWCRQLSREEHEPDVRKLLQREWGDSA